jgi:hypothetical protein
MPVDPVPAGLKTEIRVDDLILYKAIAKPLEEYDRNLVHVSVAKWMAGHGYKVNVNDAIPYVMVDNKAKDYEQKAKHPSQVDSVAECDVEWYLSTQVLPALSRLLEQFGGFPEEKIREVFGYKVVPKKQVARAPIVDVFYECPRCNAQYTLGSMAFVCKTCRTELGWKYVCNSLTKAINELFHRFGAGNQMYCSVCGFRGTQLPVSATSHLSLSHQPCERHLIVEYTPVDLYQALKKLLAQCENVTGPAQAYLKGAVLEKLSLHGLNKLRISTILAVPAWETG